MDFTNEKILEIAMEQSAIDSNCRREDFLRHEPVITISRKNPRARKYLEFPMDCDLVSYGNNVVASVQEEYREITEEYIRTYAPEHCFETPNLHVLNDALQKKGGRICFMAEYFLPDLRVLSVQDCPYEMRILHPEDFTELYTQEWSNALCAKRSELDVLGLAPMTKVVWLDWQDVPQTVRRCGRSESMCCRNTGDRELRQRLPAGWLWKSSMRGKFRFTVPHGPIYVP